ncbi:MAG: hypothetical protein GX256_05280 [Fretibacterium sp.]|nr:hypothetical protein [Fretibacterium sp.]
MKKFFLTLACLTSLLLLFSPALAAPTHEVQGEFDAKGSLQGTLVRMLARLLTPESMTVSFVGGPTEEGKIAGIYIEALGVSAGTPYRLDRLALSGALFQLAPPSQWDPETPKSLLPQKLEGFFNADLRLKEKDVQQAITHFLKESKKKGDRWSGISLDFRPGKLFARGRYKVNSGMRALFEITTGLELRGGKQIWLVDTNVKVNDDEQTDAIRSELRKHNPPVDISGFDVPLTLRVLKITDDALQVSTATSPAPLAQGETWLYRK